MTFGAAFKAYNIGLEAVGVSSWTVVVIEAVGVVWAVWKGGAWGLRGLIGKLGGLLDSAGLLPAKGSSRA